MPDNKGWIKLYRKIQESDMYQNLNSVQRDVMINCLLLANHKSKKWEWNGKIFKCKPGQFITSLSSLKDYCAKDVSIQNIRTAINKLEEWNFLTNKSTKTGRLITIINWGKYQGEDLELTKQSTNNQQSTNKALTTNKNVKNDKETYIHKGDKKIEISEAMEKYWSGSLNPNHYQVIKDFDDDLPKNIIIEAIKRSQEAEKSYYYCKSILNKWVKEEVKNMEDVIDLDKKRNENKITDFERKKKIKEDQKRIRRF
ncbi:MAG: DnaD domain protein [Bacillota bacterium]